MICPPRVTLRSPWATTFCSFGASLDEEKERKLHSIFDSGLIYHRLGEKEWKELAKELKAEITEEQLKKYRAKKDPVEWGNESLAVTQRVYENLPENGEIGQEFYEQFIGDIEDRLKAGGVHLAMILNEVFAKEAAKTGKQIEEEKSK